MLLDVQGDIKAIQKTTEALKKMTDEEKAEEYVKNLILKHNQDLVLRPKAAVTYIEELKQVYIDGLKVGREETEKQAWEYYREKCESKDKPKSIKELFERTCFIKQAEELNEVKKQWHDCFLSCSSPYCAGHFPAVKMEGELGNMSKHEGE